MVAVVAACTDAPQGQEVDEQPGSVHCGASVTVTSETPDPTCFSAAAPLRPHYKQDWKHGFICVFFVLFLGTCHSAFLIQGQFSVFSRRLFLQCIYCHMA